MSHGSKSSADGLPYRDHGGLAQHWYANKQTFSDLLVEDAKIRKFVKTRFRDGMISKIRIHRTPEKVTVYIHSGKVGVIIGKKGQEVDKLTNDLEDLTHRHIEVKTIEVNNMYLDPQLVAQDIAAQLEKRAELPADHEEGHRPDDAGRRQGHPHPDGGPAGRGRDGPDGKRHGGQHPAVHAAGPHRIWLYRGQDGPGAHRHQGLDQQRGLPEPRGRQRRPRRRQPARPRDQDSAEKGK